GNDLWTVERAGGVARPLASPPGQELFPKFSPDGQTIAFVGNYDGDRDLYLIDSFGGLAQRLTYHPSNELLCDWAGDNRLLFSAGGRSHRPQPRQTRQLYFLDVDNPAQQEELPVPYGVNASLGEDGKTLAYTPNSRDFRTWKRYTGGLATDIWLYDLEDNTATPATDWEGTDTAPMMFGGKLYYLSDRIDDANDTGRLNLFEYDPTTQEIRRITNHTDWDVKFPSMGPGPDGNGEIVYQYGSDLYLVGLDEGAKPTAVKVQIPGATPKLAGRTVDAAEFVGSAAIGPTGKRVLIEGRGDIFSVPAETGFVRPITDSPASAERYPAWSPNGRWVLFSSDADGEYNLYLRRADAPAGMGEATKLTDLTGRFWSAGQWSPDASKIAISDQTGRLTLITFPADEPEETGDEDATTNPDEAEAVDPNVPPTPESVVEIDSNPTGSPITVSWSADSRWLTYSRGDDVAYTSGVYLYDTTADEPEPLKVTSDFFNATSPAFDREGDWLYFVSSMDFRGPSYEQAGTTFVYDNLDRLIAVPLREDVENPMLPELDEEEIEEPEAKEEEENEEPPTTQPATQPADEAEADEADDAEADDEEDAGIAFDAESPIHANWSGELRGLGAMGAPDPSPFTMTIFAYADGSFAGNSTADGETTDFDSVDFADGTFTSTSTQGPITATMTGTLDGDELTGTWEAAMNGQALVDGTWSATRSGPISDEDVAEAAESGGSSSGDVDPVEIDLDGFEERAMLLPVSKGSFGNLAVNDKNQLLYVRQADGVSSIKLFDLSDDDPEEGNVVSGIISAGSFWPGFQMSADGKKLLVGAPRPGQFGVLLGGGRQVGMAVLNASKGQSISKLVPTAGMEKRLENPRDEWRGLVTDAWRRNRDFFYVENMHGVDWPAVLDQYLPMVDDATSREDVGYIIGEMIGELNVGHAYGWGGDSDESQPSRNVGLLGADFEPAGESAFKFVKILSGAPYDHDAKGPLTMPGVDVEPGEFLLAVNGRPVDATQSVYKPFLNLAGRLTTLTVSDKPELDDENENQRDVTVRPIANETSLRFRDWITHNRQLVAEKTDGRVGYIYVPNTGIEGQNELFRQFHGQMHLDGLVIDERWNGGGQIPTRFIELLNRPRTNYWARRDGRDWAWPPISHQGVQAMLINGNAGSGGDMFPWLFKRAELGPLVGTRTWGGLVGITQMPPLIDTGYVAVPSFGFYETDGTWGIEGHGVDPDIEVIDDPSKMADGTDPQLEAAIDYVMAELEAGRGYSPADRPADPDRRAVGITESDK
ncbi:MAG: S41 family peptidase, partial [Planctomycetota bacterium]